MIVSDTHNANFFAGIGGWPLALRLSNWPKGKEVWTGSCPCQPFSVAGKQKGFEDERDLWPEFYRLIRERRPATVFGEQVASASTWLARVRSDLEAMDYALGAVPVQAASGGACQLRDRFWFMAHDTRELLNRSGDIRTHGRTQHTDDGGGMLARQRSARLEEREGQSGDVRPELTPVERNRSVNMVSSPCDGWGEGWTESEFRSRGFTAAVASLPDGQGGAWQFIECPDGKYRRLPPPRVRWLGNGVQSRVDQLRAFGNAIYVPLAVQVINAGLEAERDMKEMRSRLCSE